MAFFLSQFLFYLIIFDFVILALSSISISNLIVHVMLFFSAYNYEILAFYNILKTIFYEIVKHKGYLMVRLITN